MTTAVEPFWMRTALAMLLVVHGVAHLVGFVVPWRLMPTPAMPYTTIVLGIDVGQAGVRTVGVAWQCLAAVMVGLGLTLFLTHRLSSLAPLLVWASLLFCILGWPHFRIGIFVNVLLLTALTLAR